MKKAINSLFLYLILFRKLGFLGCQNWHDFSSGV